MIKIENIDRSIMANMNEREKKRYLDFLHNYQTNESDTSNPVLAVNQLPKSVKVKREALGNKATKACLAGGAAGLLVAGPLGWFVGGIIGGLAASVSEQIKIMSWPNVQDDKSLYQNVQLAVKAGKTSGSYIMGSDKIHFYINY